MPEVEIRIGGRSFHVACQEGEEQFLQSAAALLDHEAQTLAGALGRVPESRMLLMAGLMLADKTAGLEEELRVAERRIKELSARNALTPAPEKQVVEVQVEVPVIPDEVTEAFARIAQRAEEVAAEAEEKLAVNDPAGG